MLIDDTHPEETRVVVLDGNKLEDVEFESSSRKQIKGNIYLAKVMRVEPSLQAAFIDYGGNKHGFLAFGEIHPDYYNIPEQELAEIEKEIDDQIEAKKQALKDREAERDRRREEREQAKAEAQKNAEEALAKEETTEEEPTLVEEAAEETTTEEPEKKKNASKRLQKKTSKNKQKDKAPKVLTENSGIAEETISEDYEAPSKTKRIDDDNDLDDDDEQDSDFDVQKKLLIARKLYHKSKIQDVIKEGQIMVVQVAKEERGNKGAALTTYLSLAGRYCVLMPNRIKSGGVSRKITNGNDRKRLKNILRDLPLGVEMSMIVRTAGEDKSKQEIVRDYNYLIRSWNMIKTEALKNKAPALIHEEANLIKRALRDMFTKDISEIVVDGNNAYKAAKDFMKILSPQSLKKLKTCHDNDIPLFQRFQVEGQLEKLHDTNVQLESGGYLVINPTEALVAIDVNSGRATKEKDLEETALKTNLEAADEIARQLRLRNLAGLVVIDFIDMDETSNDNAVERRMKEALKKDRSRVQVGKMSCFGLIELSRQRMHPSFFETSYETCPHCRGKGIIRTVESCAVSLLRDIESEGIKNKYSNVNISVPSNVAVYLLNQKRTMLCSLENKYSMTINISADDDIKNISNYKIERTKATKGRDDNKETVTPVVEENNNDDNVYVDTPRRENHQNNNNNRRRHNNNNNRRNNRDHNRDYNRDRNESSEQEADKKDKSSWWKKLIGG